MPAAAAVAVAAALRAAGAAAAASLCSRRAKTLLYTMFCRKIILTHSTIARWTIMYHFILKLKI